MEPSSAQDLLASRGSLDTQIQGTLSKIAPLATSWHDTPTVGAVGAAQQLPSGSSSQSNMSKLGTFIGKFGSEVGRIAQTVGGAAVTAAKNAVLDPVHVAQGITHLTEAAISDHQINSQIDSLNQQRQQLSLDYQSGKINKLQYGQGLKQVTDNLNNTSKQATENTTKINNAGQQVKGGAMGTVLDAVQILSLGVAAPLDAAVAGSETTQAAISFLRGSDLGEAVLNVSKAVDETISSSVFNGLGTMGTEEKSVAMAVKAAYEAGGATSGAIQLAKSTASQLLIQRPLVYNALGGTAKQIYSDLQNKKYGDAVVQGALLVSLSLSGGPIGWAKEQLGKAGGAISNAVFGESSFMDMFGAHFGDASSVYKYIKSHPEDAASLKAMEQINMKKAGGNVPKAVAMATDWLDSSTFGGSKTPEDALHNLIDWHKATEIAQKDALAHGATADEASRIVAGRWAQADNLRVQKVVKDTLDNMAGASPEDTRNAVHYALDQFAQETQLINPTANGTIMDQLHGIIEHTPNLEDVSKEINRIDTAESYKGLGAKATQAMKDLGYVPSLPKSLDAKFVSTADVADQKLSTKFAQGEDSVFQKAVQPLPVLGSLGNVFTKAGLSPNESAQKVSDIFAENFDKNLAKTGNFPQLHGDLQTTGETIMQKLAAYAKSPEGLLKRAPITDYRQMTVKEVMKATGSSAKESKQIMTALMDAHIQVPTAIKGLGEQITDVNAKYNPLATTYARLQGASRYVYNPFFKLRQEASAEIMSQLEARGKFITFGPTDAIEKMFFPGQYEKLQETAGILKTEGIFAPGLGSEFAGSAGAVGTHLPAGVERSLAGVVNSMADKVGVDVNTFVQNNREDVINAVRGLVQYPKNGNFVNSPLAKTINLAFFPFRHNVKVSGQIAKFLADSNPMTQFAVLKGMLDFHNFINSDQGIAWQAKNAEAIGVFKYLTPAYSLTQVAGMLGQRPHSVAQYGELGGLPFGFIPALLDSAGVTNFNQPYISPSTGEQIPKYVPTGARSDANLAIQDLLGQMFSYPGATVGLPSKSSINRAVAGGLVGGSKQFDQKTQTLTPGEQHQSDVIKQSVGQPTSKQKAAPPTTPPSNPAVKVPRLAPQQTPTIKFKSPAPKAKKKSDYRPAPLT